MVFRAVILGCSCVMFNGCSSYPRKRSKTLVDEFLKGGRGLLLLNSMNGLWTLFSGNSHDRNTQKSNSGYMLAFHAK
jgi:hypothetical protein